VLDITAGLANVLSNPNFIYVVILTLVSSDLSAVAVSGSVFSTITTALARLGSGVPIMIRATSPTFSGGGDRFRHSNC
jgi:hypothetical protein